jgi:hypothetical protein
MRTGLLIAMGISHPESVCGEPSSSKQIIVHPAQAAHGQFSSAYKAVKTAEDAHDILVEAKGDGRT